MLKKKLLCFATVYTLAITTIGCSSNRDLFEPVESPEVSNLFYPQTVWSQSTQGSQEIYSQLVPCVNHNQLYIAGREGKVYSLNAANGDKNWTTDLSDEEENDTKRSARLSGGVSASDVFVTVGSENGYIYVLNRKDGTLYFKHYLGQEILSLPVFNASGDKLFVQDATGGITAYDLANKKVLWSSGDSATNLHLRTKAKLTVVGDELLVAGTSSGRLLMISQADGYILNQIQVGQNNGSSDLERISDVSSTPLILGDSIYSTAYNSGFIKYSLEKGAVVGKLDYHSSNDIAYDDNFFVISSENSVIYCVRRSDNVEAWANSQLLYRNVTAPTIYGNYAVVGDLEGYVYFINLNDGIIDAKIQVGDEPIYVQPIVVGNCLVIYSSSGRLEVVCYDPIDIVIAKKRFTDIEQVTGNTTALIAASTMSSDVSSGVSKGELEKRRAEARRIVAEIDRRQREAEAQYREYLRQKAEYEKRVAEYEKQKREQLSGFGLMPEAGVKSDDDVEYVEVE